MRVKRVFSILFSALTVISLLLAIATAIAFFRTFFATDRVSFVEVLEKVHSPPVVRTLSLEAGYIRYASIGKMNVSGEHEILIESNKAPSWTFNGLWKANYVGNDNPEYPLVGLDLPLPYLLLASLVLPGFFLASRFRSRGKLRGHCAACGYDMRANPAKCSECGHDANEVTSSV